MSERFSMRVVLDCYEQDRLFNALDLAREELERRPFPSEKPSGEDSP